MKKLYFVKNLAIIFVFFQLIFSCKKDNSIEESKSDRKRVEEKFCPLVLIDIDSNIYNVKKIGNQCWITENYKVKHYNNGDLISTTDDPNAYTLNDIEAKYQWAYDGKDSNLVIYGRLYTWTVITDSRGFCPKGWHIPSKEELLTLVDAVGGKETGGSKLKEAGNTHWNSYTNVNSDNSSGFSALPSGQRNALNYNGFRGLGTSVKFWSTTLAPSTSTSSGSLWCLMLNNMDNTSIVDYYGGEPYSAKPVRLIMD